MTAATRELNAETMSTAEIRALLGALGPGETVQVVSPEAPDDLLEELQEEEEGRFEWSRLETGPSRTRLEVRRRASEGPRSVTSYLEADHDRLDAIVPEVERLAHAGSFMEARARFGVFVCGLDWHIEAEEQVLFPMFEAKTGMTHGPTQVMRGEHVDIRARMHAVAEALGAEDVARVNGALGELIGLLSSHNQKEEKMLYPMMDRALDFDAQERLVRRIEAF